MTRSRIKRLLFRAGVVATLLVAVIQPAHNTVDIFEPAPQAQIETGELPPLPSVGRPDVGEPDDKYLPVSEETARKRNAARMFSSAPLVAANPFRSRLEGEERERAVACLAVAAIYEAGGKANDQLPVMQVILNRVRHPAWPNSICGVVFQGSERRTGCQFSFTCDGSMLRWRPSAASVEATRRRAEAMLAGQVEKRVGLATHYHTNWVLPHWSASLDKIAAVNTHLFFRWNGYWASKASFTARPSSIEPQIALLTGFEDAHGIAENAELSEEELSIGLADAGDSAAAADTQAAEVELPAYPIIAVELDPHDMPGRWSLDAVAKCSKNPECRVIGWVDANRKPGRVTLETLAANPPDFVYVQEMRNRVRQAYWDCSRWPKAPSSRCLAGSVQAAGLIY